VDGEDNGKGSDEVEIIGLGRKVINERKMLRFVMYIAVILAVITPLLLFQSYRLALQNGVKLYHRLYFVKAEHLVETAALRAGSEGDYLETLKAVWDEIPDKPEDEYICIVDTSTKLVLHSKAPWTVGNDVSGNLLPEERTTLGSLNREKRDFIGTYISSSGERQLAVFRTTEGRPYLLGIHRSESALIEEVRTTLKGLLITGILIIFLVSPILILVLYFIFRLIIQQRIEVENALREKESDLNSLFENMVQAVIYCRLLRDESGKAYDFEILNCNRSFERVFGYSSESVIGKSSIDIWPDAQEWLPAWMPSLENVSEMIETVQGEHFLKDIGKWVSLTVYSAKKGQFVCIFEDISEKRQHFQALAASEERYDLAVSATNEGLFDWNLESGRIWYNKRCMTMLGLMEDEADPDENAWLTRIHAEDEADVRDRYYRYLKQEIDSFEMEFRMRHNGGHYVHVLVRGIAQFGADDRAVRMVGTIQDITYRKLSESKLKENQQLLKAVADNFPRSFVGIIERDMNLSYISGALFSSLGLKERDYVGHSVLEYFPGKEAMVQEALAAAFSGEEHEFLYENNRIVLNYRVVPIRDASGEINRALTVAEDITERVEAEKEHRHLEEQLSHSRKLEGIGQLAGGIAHDFNNILTASIGFTDLTRHYLEQGNPRAKESLEQIDQCNVRAVNLIRQLLTFSRRQKFEAQILDINALLDDMRKMLRRIVPENIDLNIGLLDRSVHVKADPSQIEQVITNLVVNARDAINAGSEENIGSVELILEHKIFTEDMDLGLENLRAGEYVLIRVKDSGVGMDESTMEQIFTPYFTTKAVGKGTGLGLATVYGIVTQNRGQIEVRSEPGRGSEFRVLWPVTTEKHAEAAIDESGEEYHGDEHVLMVEDDELIRNMTSRYLRARGYHVTEAENGREAVSLMEKAAEGFDILFTDVVMPEMGGTELGRIFGEKYPGKPILFTSGYNDVLVNRDGVINDGIDFLRKPYTLQAMLQRIRQMLGEQGQERLPITD